jgi:hypothetical protein
LTATGGGFSARDAERDAEKVDCSCEQPGREIDTVVRNKKLDVVSQDDM